jgi:hypothetical protein
MPWTFALERHPKISGAIQAVTDATRLKTLLRQAIQCKSLEEFQASLRA